MPDTFRAELYCRKSDKELFEDSGFEVEVGDIPDYPHCVLMVDNLATITQIAELPTAVPYFGSTAAAYEFDATRFSCDSQKFWSITSPTVTMIVSSFSLMRTAIPFPTTCGTSKTTFNTRSARCTSLRL